MARPSVTAAQLLEALLERKVLTHDDLVSVFGEERHHLTVSIIERAIVGTARLNDAQLSDVKAAVAGLPPLGHLLDLRPSSLLSREVSRRAGAVVVGESPLTVAMVEDLDSNVQAVAADLAVEAESLVIRLCTLGQFAELHRAAYKDETIAVLPEAESIADVFDECVRSRGSDAHLSVGQPPVLRIDGSLVPMKTQPLSEEWMRREILRLAGPERFAVWEENKDADMAYAFGSARFRINFGRDQKGPTIAARRLPSKIPTPTDLGLPRAVQAFANLERGLVLITGPTGSGKSTTMAAILGSLINSSSRHVLTLEDPIEFQFPQGHSVVHQREFGRDFTSFPSGLRQALRQDPDVIFVGEMRDTQTIATAVTAAETGHLVFGTLHSHDVSSTVGRMVGSFPPEEQDHVRAQLAYVLKGIVSQTLIPLARGEGRVAAYEVLVSTPAIANMLRKTDGQNAIRQIVETSARDGMQTMDMALVDLVRRGQIHEEDALKLSRDPEEFVRRLRDS